MTDTIVIGAGISGLVAAYRLKQSGRDVLLLEAGDRPGGVIRTKTVDGFLLEQGPNSVRITPEIDALAEELGLAGEMVVGDPHAPRYIYYGGKLQLAPMGPASAMTTSLISKRAKLRVLGEPFVSRPKTPGEQSIKDFVTRRLGREIHDVFVSAFVSGIYAGDTSRLSIDAVFPKLAELEREHGGLVKGAFASMRERKAKRAAEPPPPAEAPAKPKRRGMTIVSFETGLARLPERIGEVLGESLMLNAPVAGVERRDGRFAVSTGSETLEAAELVLAVPADSAANFLRPHSARLADLLDGVEYPPLASVTLAYEDDDVTHPCTGFGFLAPRTAGLRTLGGLFPSSLFPGRAPEGWKSFTCFIGGATDPGAVELSDDELVAQVSGDLERAVGATGDPRVLSVTRWARAIPQYNIGHVARVAEIEREARALGVRMLGNYLHGVSVGDCISAASKAVHESHE